MRGARWRIAPRPNAALRRNEGTEPAYGLDFSIRSSRLAMRGSTGVPGPNGSLRQSDPPDPRSSNRAAKTLQGISHFGVFPRKGKVEKAKIVEYRVTMEVTFILD